MHRDPRVPLWDVEQADQIPDRPRIIGFRNVLAHGYDSIAPEDVRDHSQNDLLALRVVVQDMLDELGPPEA